MFENFLRMTYCMTLGGFTPWAVLGVILQASGFFGIVSVPLILAASKVTGRWNEAHAARMMVIACAITLTPWMLPWWLVQSDELQVLLTLPGVLSGPFAMNAWYLLLWAVGKEGAGNHGAPRG